MLIMCGTKMHGFNGLTTASDKVLKKVWNTDVRNV